MPPAMPPAATMPAPHERPNAAETLFEAKPAPPLLPGVTGVELISAERRRQVTEEGWSAENDDEHTAGELALAAAAYALTGIEDIAERPLRAEIRRLFPWSPDWLKPQTPIRDLTRAGALIAAELDRLMRADPVSVERSY